MAANLSQLQGNAALTVDKQPLDKRAAELLRQRIVSGMFPPGYRLVEATLSEHMNLSRGTVRSALSELAHEGLVTQKAYTRWAVSELSAVDAWELFTLRSALEALAARLAAERADGPGRGLLWKAFEKLESAARSGRRGPLTDADFLLHKTIIELAGHRRLAHQYRLLEQQFRVLIGSSNALVPTTSEVVAQHRPIVEAITSGHAIRAEKLAAQHNAQEGAALVAHVQKCSQPGSGELPFGQLCTGKAHARSRRKASDARSELASRRE
jgi:DNA-binding GntR family transcriptional regulator